MLKGPTRVVGYARATIEWTPAHADPDAVLPPAARADGRRPPVRRGRSTAPHGARTTWRVIRADVW